jgi:hypothetical protein
MDVPQFTNCALTQSDKKFSFLSLNIQSIHAKFSAFEDMINLMQASNCAPNIILLQETWQIQNADALMLNNYNDPFF